METPQKIRTDSNGNDHPGLRSRHLSNDLSGDAIAPQ